MGHHLRSFWKEQNVVETKLFLQGDHVKGYLVEAGKGGYVFVARGDVSVPSTIRELSAEKVAF